MINEIRLLSSFFKMKSFLVFILLNILLHSHTLSQSSTVYRPRIIITADPELDDNNSLIRLILYSNELNIEGLIYTSSQFHWKGDGKGTKWYIPGREYDRFGLNICPCTSWRWAKDERFIHDIVDAYAKAYSNLKVHDTFYPTPEYLRSKIRYGNIEFDGDYSKDTPGSDLIKAAILDNKPGTLYITAWGGHSSIAGALKSIQDQYVNSTEWEALRSKISRKVVLLPSGDQDNTYELYIKPNWPDIEYRQHRRGPNYGYGAQMRATEENKKYLTPAWMKENINDRKPFGDLYRVWGDGKQMVKGDVVDYFGLSGYTGDELKKMGYAVWMPVQEKGSWLGEGDNHTFMNMMGNGLRAYEHGSYGGWGGIVDNPTDVTNIMTLALNDNADSLAKRIARLSDPTNIPFPNFFPAAQNDFATRLTWAVSPKYSDANHAPSVQIQGPLEISAAPGQKIKLHATVSDPDGDKLSSGWWQFQVGTYPNKIDITKTANTACEFSIPKDAVKGQTVHMVCEVRDDKGLVRYGRVILVVR